MNIKMKKETKIKQEIEKKMEGKKCL